MIVPAEREKQLIYYKDITTILEPMRFSEGKIYYNSLWAGQALIAISADYVRAVPGVENTALIKDNRIF